MPRDKKHDIDENEEEIVFDADTEYAEEPSSYKEKYEKKINTLKSNLEACQKDKEDYLQGWQRSKADFINLKKQNEQVFSYARESTIVDVVGSLLPTLDSFEMSLKGDFDEAFKKWFVGFEYVYTQLKKTLEEYGVSEINPLNEAFDPKFHEALEEMKTEDEKKDHTVAEVILKGYAIKDRIIRAASVKVYKYDK